VSNFEQIPPELSFRSSAASCLSTFHLYPGSANAPYLSAELRKVRDADARAGVHPADKPGRPRGKRISVRAV
jgi:hypothetical protein